MHLRRALFLSVLTLAASSGYGQIRTIAHADTTVGNHFGAAVALDAERGRAVIGATGEARCGANAGAAYVFERDAAGALAEAARLEPADCASGDLFGRAVALSGDRALVAAGGEFVDPGRPNRAYLFERDASGAWQQAATLTAEPGHNEGVFAAAIDLEGDRALVTTAGDPAQRAYGGAAYVFERNASGAWQQTARLVGSAGTRAGIFGSHARLDGDRALVTASPYDNEGTGSVYIFERDGTASGRGAWRETARIGSVRGFTVRADLDGDRLLVGHSAAGPDRSGRTLFYHRTNDGAWRRVSTLVPSTSCEDCSFGEAVSLDGDRALVVGYGEQIGLGYNVDRVVYSFAYTPEAGWVQQQVMDLGRWAFGAALDQAGRTAIIGQASDAQPGVAYLVELL
ncbi:MAG: hypothetical protein AAGI91_10180 [Bacteroidota bacterium]